MEEKNSFGSIRKDIKVIRGRVELLKVSDRMAAEKGEEAWNLYSYSALDYVKSFGVTFPDALDIPKRLKERKERGERVLVVDICGEADAESLGADKTIALTLTRAPSRPPKDSLEIVEGDVFSSPDTKRLMDRIEAEHTPIACVFCRPLGGFFMYGKSTFALGKLYSVLRDLYGKLAEGGEMYIEIPMTHEVSDVVTGLSVAFDRGVFQVDESGPLFEIHVTKTTKAPGALPALNEFPKRR